DTRKRDIQLHEYRLGLAVGDNSPGRDPAVVGELQQVWPADELAQRTPTPFCIGRCGTAEICVVRGSIAALQAVALAIAAELQAGLGRIIIFDEKIFEKDCKVLACGARKQRNDATIGRCTVADSPSRVVMPGDAPHPTTW